MLGAGVGEIEREGKGGGIGGETEIGSKRERCQQGGGSISHFCWNQTPAGPRPERMRMAGGKTKLRRYSASDLRRMIGTSGTRALPGFGREQRSRKSAKGHKVRRKDYPKTSAAGG